MVFAIVLVGRRLSVGGYDREGMAFAHRWRLCETLLDYFCGSKRVYRFEWVVDGGHSRIRTYDFHRVKVALYR